MPLETGTYISDFVLTNPDGDTDTVASLDDQDRLIKTFVQNSFPSINGPVTCTPTELNYNDGSTPGTITNSKTVVYGAAGQVNATTLQVGGTSITATPAELNLLDGATFSTTEANLLTSASSLVIQHAYTLYSTQTSGTTVMILDDTTPQNTEGDEYMTVSITPKSSSNLLKIEVLLHFSVDAANYGIMALFQDSTADALSSAIGYQGAGGLMGTIPITYWMTAGTVSSTTFKVRAGIQSSGTFYVNRRSSANVLNDTVYSSITVTEYTP